MKVEVAVLGSPSLVVRTVSVDVKQHGTISSRPVEVMPIRKANKFVCFTLSLSGTLCSERHVCPSDQRSPESGHIRPTNRK